MPKLQTFIGFAAGIAGLLFIAVTTFLRDDAYLLVKANILLPFILITLSLSFITYGVKPVVEIYSQAFLLLTTGRPPANEQFTKILRVSAKYALTASLTWILYSAVYVAASAQYSVRSFISFSLVALLYVFIYKMFFVDIAINKCNFTVENNKEK